MDISIIIPCLNEVIELPSLLRLLLLAADKFDGSYEIIVVDGGSTDGTYECCQHNPDITVLQTSANRAQQMNLGSKHASGEILYFIHADSRPPIHSFLDVYNAVKQGQQIGGYAFEFDSQRQILAINNFFTTFNIIATRGGDQSIFITKSAFHLLGGFDPQMKIMEEYDLLKRAKQSGLEYHLLNTGKTLVSARKYHNRSWLKVQVANIVAMAMWRFGASSEKIKNIYERMLA